MVPRIGGTDVHLGEVLLEPDRLHGEVLGLVPLPGVGLLVLIGGTRADVVVPDVGDLDVHLSVVLHECLHNGGVVLLVLHESLHLGAVLQLGQRRPQDLDPRHGEHNVRPVVVLQYPPHLHGEVLGLVPLPGVGLLVLGGGTRADVVVHIGGVLPEPLHSDGVGLLVLHGVLDVRALLGAELQLGEAQG